MTQHIKQRISETTYAILHEHGLHDWTVEFGSAYNIFGSCNHTDKVLRFSLRFAEALPWEETYDTIVHEIAHAIAGYDAGHGIVWKRIARELGVKHLSASVDVDIEFEEPWVGTCLNGHTVTMKRAPQRVRSCAICSGGRGFTPEFIFEWRKHGEIVNMPARYQRELEIVWEESLLAA